MCGIAGSIGKGHDHKILRTLLLLNSDRGNEATGFFNSHGTIWKRAMSPSQALAGAKLNKFLAKSDDCWFMALHTRLGTRGANIRDNAHPFRYGTYTGSHNGCVDAPNHYAVDSMYLIDQLSKNNNDYQKALEDVGGYWSISWTDGTSFYLQVHRQSLSLTKVGDTWYYSSDSKHLRAALGDIKFYTLAEGETLRFTHNAETGETVMSKLPPLNHTPEKYQQWNPRTQGSTYTNYSGSNYTSNSYRSSTTTTDSGRAFVRDESGKWVEVNQKSKEENDLDKEFAAIVGDVVDADVPDYDARWQDAWAEYNSEYATPVSDQ